jgi:hypothetical protein
MNEAFPFFEKFAVVEVIPESISNTNSSSTPKAADDSEEVQWKGTPGFKSDALPFDKDCLLHEEGGSTCCKETHPLLRMRSAGGSFRP